VIVKPLPEISMSGDFRVANAEIGVRRIVAQTILPRAALNLCDTFAAQPFVRKQGGGRGVPQRPS
jgi:hypothetical protein